MYLKAKVAIQRNSKKAIADTRTAHKLLCTYYRLFRVFGSSNNICKGFGTSLTRNDHLEKFSEGQMEVVVNFCRSKPATIQAYYEKHPQQILPAAAPIYQRSKGDSILHRPSFNLKPYRSPSKKSERRCQRFHCCRSPQSRRSGSSASQG